MAEDHDSRLLAATYLAFYRRTGKPGRLPVVCRLLEQSRARWRALAAVADSDFADDLVFGFREKGHCGHRRDDLEVVERDLAVKEQLTPHGEAPQVEIMGWPGDDIHPPPPQLDFTPPAHVQSGRDLLLRLDVSESEERCARTVRCFHRIAHQALDFEVIDMRAEESGFSTAIPGDAIDPAWDLMLFFEFKFSDGSATRWPVWRTD